MELNKIPADWERCREGSICCSRVICIKLSAVVPFDYIRLEKRLEKEDIFSGDGYESVFQNSCVVHRKLILMS